MHVDKDYLRPWCGRQEGAGKCEPAVSEATQNKDTAQLFLFFFLTPSKRITSAAIKLHKRQRHSINYIHRSRGLTWAAKSSAGGTVFTFIYQSIATAVLIYCCFPLSLSVAFVIPITGEARQQILRDTSLKNILHICHVFIISHTFCPSLFSLCSQTFVRLVSF